MHDHERLATHHGTARRRECDYLRLRVVCVQLRIECVVRCVHRDLERVYTRCLGRSSACQQRLIHKCRVHNRAAEATQIRQAAMEACAVHSHTCVAANRPACRAECRHARGRQICKQHVAAGELLSIEGKLYTDGLILECTMSTRKSVGANLDVGQQMLIDRRTRPSAPTKLPARKRLPAWDGQIANQHVAIVNDAKPIPAVRDHHRHKALQRT